MGFAQNFKKATKSEQIKIEKELSDFGLHWKQIIGLKKHDGIVTDLELNLMAKLSKNPSIHTVKNLLRTTKRLELIEETSEERTSPQP